MKAILIIVALLVATVAQVQAKPEKENSVLCTICTFVTNVVEEYLQNNATEAKIEQVLGKVCNLFGSYQSECQDFVNSEVPAIIQLLLNKESPQVICTQLHACTSKFAEKPKPKPVEVVVPKPKQGGALCSICEVVIQTVESYIASNATQQEIIAGLENFCNALPGSISATCDAIVEQYTPMAIQWLLNNENPQTFCTQISLCSSARLPAADVQPKPQQGGACGICELAIASVEQYLQQNQTEAQIIAFLENICNSLPGGIGSICDSIVDQYVPLMVNWLVQNEPPQVFCTQIGLCSSDSLMRPLRRANARPLTRLTRPNRR